MHVGEDPGGAAVRESAILVPYTTMAVGLLQGAKLCEAEDVSLDWYADFVQQSFPPLIEDALRKARNPEFAMNPEKAEGTIRQGEFYTAELAEYLDELGIDSGMLAAVHRLCEAALEEGRGDHGIAYLAEVEADHSG